MKYSDKQIAAGNSYLNDSESLIIKAVAGSGKEQPVWCNVQTPKGKVTIGSLNIGDTIFGLDGKLQEVLGIFPQGEKDYYKITFRDGSFTYCGLEHLWTINNAGKRADKLKTFSLKEMLERGITRLSGDYRFRIPLCEPVEYPEVEVKIPPYVLGLMIGDGYLSGMTPALSFNAEDPKIIERCIQLLPGIKIKPKNTSEKGLQTTLVPEDKESANSTNWIKTYVKELSLNVPSGNKFIPKEYLYNSIENRKELLRGLMDSDGTCIKNRTSFSTTSEFLVADMKILVNSLGGTAILRKPYIREGRSTCYDLNVKTHFCPFGVSKKANNWKFSKKNGPSRYITAVEKMGKCEQVCIKVSNPDHLYLTDNFIVTHNTSTLMYLLDLVKKKTLYLAFNKSVQEEVQNKFEKKGFKHAKSMTIHGLGMQTLRTEYSKLDVSNNKNWGIINTLQKEQPALYRGLSTKNKYALNFTLIELNNSARTWYTEDLDALTKILKANGTNVAKLPCLKDAWKAFIDLRDKGYQAKSYLEIDYLDMVYLPVKLGLDVPVKPTYLLIDECQDLSLIQHMFVDLLIDQPTLKKFVAVGDPSQAIYGFSGAMSDSYKHFYSKSKPVIELPLDVTYRCPQLVVDEANMIYPGMIAHKETAGIVRTEIITDFSQIEDESMIVCRNTEPLIDVYLNLVAAGKACYLDGDNFLKYLKKFVNYYMGQTVADTLEKLNKEYEQKLAKSRGDEDRLELFIYKENLNILNKVAKTFSFYGKTIKELLNQFENIFKTRKNSIVLCTIHKAKGLECDTVYFLEPGLIPSKFATTEEQLIQEENLRYVAVTRAKEKLIYLNTKK